MKPSQSQHPRAGRDTTGPARGVSKPVLKRAITASAIGNATEWFDYGLYAYGISYISAALFPGSIEQATFFALAGCALLAFFPAGALPGYVRDPARHGAANLKDEPHSTASSPA